ncbi:MAG: tyrosine-type recombinase/integrase, partial [Methyloprofundus sp.]|nr:tyrosine-type recombinase/integrase [Methyloprofundus sp.]
TVVIGLKLLVGKNGNKKFLYRYSYKGKKRSIAIGALGAFSVDQARAIANQHKATVASGEDPKQVRNDKLSEMTFAEFAKDLYLPHSVVNKRSSKSDESKLRLYLIPAFGERTLSSISTQSIQQYQNKLLATLSPATANRHFSLLHRMFALAIQWGYLEKNPCTNVNKFQENNQRQRFLSNKEIRNLFTAADQDANTYAAAYIKFLLLTGVRKSEGLAAKWDDIQIVSGRRVWHIPHTKSGKSRHVILNPMAIDILEALPKVEGNPYLFPGKVPGTPIQNPIKAFKRIIKRAGIEESFRLHDIRHTVASLIINNGGSLYDVQATLAHANSKMSDRYAHLSNERLQNTSDNLSNVVAGAIGVEEAVESNLM